LGKCTKIGRLLQSCIGTAAVGLVAVGAMGQTKFQVTKAAGGTMDPASVMDMKDNSNRMAFPQDLPAGGIVNRGSPNLGGGCQLALNANGLNYGPLFHTADNFNVQTTGALTGVSWSAVYRAGTAAPFPDGPPPATETFVIRILSDVAGVPTTQLYSTTVTNPTRVNSGTLLGVLTIYDYTALALPTPVTLNAGTCYWLEITNTSILPGGAGTNVSFWVTGGPADGQNMQDDSPDNIAGCNGYDAADVGQNDMTFCINLATNTLDGSNCPLVTLPVACVNPAANGNGVDTASNVGFNSATPGSVFPATITGVFQRAENFQVASAGNLNSICFWGFFLGTGLTANSCARDFDVIVWNNSLANGQPSTIRNVGAVADKVGTNGVTVTRTLDVLGGDEVFTVNLPVARQIPLSAATCYHLTISNTFNTGVAAISARFVWGITPAATPLGGPIDNRFLSRAVTSGSAVGGPWTVTTAADNRFNCSYLLNVGPATATNCLPPAPANDTCATATPLNLAGTVVNGSNVNGTNEALPGTAFDIVEGSTVWYTFTGNGNDVNITTCGAASPLDSILHVYCAPNGCAGPFNRVFGNDDDATPCASNALSSRVIVSTVSGTIYYVVVAGFGGAQDLFQISATSGAPSPATVCTPNCDLNAAASDVQEADACGSGTGLDTNNTCATATATYVTLGQTARGSVSTIAAGGTRDIDIWRMPASSNGATVGLRLNSENPVLVQFLNDASGTCATAFTVVPNSTFGLAACTPLTTEVFTVTLPATGNNYFLITTPSFGGSPCTLGLDEYRFQVQAAVQGACCLLNTACFFTTFDDCNAQSTGDPNDFFAPNQACSPDPCLSQPGKCCFPDLTCQLVPSAGVANSTVCTGAGGTYTAAGVCTPNTCTASTIACCRGATCVLVSPAACTGMFQQSTVATACNSPITNGTTPCCRADYNKAAGIGVQDIFDFLAGYFTTNIFADANESGAVGVQDIFDYLAFYFQAGCP